MVGGFSLGGISFCPTVSGGGSYLDSITRYRSSSPSYSRSTSNIYPRRPQNTTIIAPAPATDVVYRLSTGENPVRYLGFMSDGRGRWWYKRSDGLRLLNPFVWKIQKGKLIIFFQFHPDNGKPLSDTLPERLIIIMRQTTYFLDTGAVNRREQSYFVEYDPIMESQHTLMPTDTKWSE